MKELTQIRTAVIDALQASGVQAAAAFPAERAREYTGAAAAVSVGNAGSRTLGMSSYLGERYDEKTGTVQEVYGKLLEGWIAVDIRTPSAAACESGCEAAAEILLGGLPAGIRPGELSWEALAWERETGMFLRRGKLQCQALFTAGVQEDGEMFLDFILKGVMKE